MHFLKNDLLYDLLGIHIGVNCFFFLYNKRKTKYLLYGKIYKIIMCIVKSIIRVNNFKCYFHLMLSNFSGGSTSNYEGS